MAVPVPLTDGADTVAGSTYMHRRLQATVPLTDRPSEAAWNDRSAVGSIHKAVIHTGSRGGGLVASTNVVAVFPRTIIILHSYVESAILRDSHPSRFCVPPGIESSPDQN